MTWLLLLPVALAAGMAAPTQFAINSQLRQVVGGPVLAAALSCVAPCPSYTKSVCIIAHYAKDNKACAAPEFGRVGEPLSQSPRSGLT